MLQLQMMNQKVQIQDKNKNESKIDNVAWYQPLMQELTKAIISCYVIVLKYYQHNTKASSEVHHKNNRS